MTMKITPQVEAYFHANRPKGDPGKCWLWTGPFRLKGTTGYGDLAIHKPRPSRGFIFRELAHRVAWVLENGPIPKGMYVLHRCDVRPCCNPSHLFLGTYKDNAQDKMQKGRAKPVRGRAHPKAKLTDEQVREIRRRALAGESSVSLAAEFGISPTLVFNIRTGRAWKHI